MNQILNNHIIEEEKNNKVYRLIVFYVICNK